MTVTNGMTGNAVPKRRLAEWQYTPSVTQGTGVLTWPCRSRSCSRQPSATSKAVTLRVSRLNSTPIKWIGSPPPRYFAA